MKLLKVIIFLGALWLFLTGASCPPYDKPIKRESPEKNLKVLKDALEKGDYSTAYYCLSKNTRNRPGYEYGNFKMMLEWTIFGVLIKSMLINWDIKSVKYFNETVKDSDGKTTKTIEKARVLLQHWKYSEYQKEFIFIYENNGWRIDFTLAGIIGMPQEDEDNLFPVPHNNDK
ncbi:MAG: hypothetical protein V1709_05410 [Planctomycetota bacterium]